MSIYPTMSITEYFARAKARKAKRVEKHALLGVRKVKKPRRRSEWKHWVGKLDAVFSLFIKLRDKRYGGGLCRICGRAPIQCCYHIMPRQHLATRWVEVGAVGACNGCNASEHFNRLAYRQKHIALFGDIYDALEKLSRTTVKYSVDDLRDLTENFKIRMAAP